MLRYSLNESRLADLVEQAVRRVVAEGLRTADIVPSGQQPVGTDEMGDAVVHALLQISHE